MVNIDSQISELLSDSPEMALRRRYLKVINGLELKNKDRVLDMGCGDGYFLYILSNIKLSLDLYGADFDKRALKSAKINLGGKKIKLSQVNLMKKSHFDESYFDKVSMNEVVEHLPSAILGLKEVYRVLKKGGILCLTVPNRNYPFLWDPINWMLERLIKKHINHGFFAGIWNQHSKLYYKNNIMKEVKRAGFKIIEVKPLTYWTLPFNHYIINFGARLLYDKHLSPDLAKQISKFKPNKKRSFVIRSIFSVMKMVDSFNVNYQGEVSSNIFVKAQKP